MSAFAKPSEVRASEETELLRRGELFDHMGRRKIILPGQEGEENPKLAGYTRATTYIKALEDTAGLEKWKIRLIVEGAAEAQLEQEALLAYEQLLADEAEADATLFALLEEKGGKVTKKAREEIMGDPGRTYRKRLAEIAEYAFELAGGRDAANYGTELHSLFEAYLDGDLPQERIDDAEELWSGISIDFQALLAAWDLFVRSTGARVVMTEGLVVNDKLRVAGRTDIIALAKLPGDERARRVIMDIKSGSIDGELKLSQQLATYAGSKGYDPETGERKNLRIRQDVGICIHVPRGEGKASFRVVQLARGRQANALVAKVRESRRKIPGLVTPLILDVK